MAKKPEVKDDEPTPKPSPVTSSIRKSFAVEASATKELEDRIIELQTRNTVLHARVEELKLFIRDTIHTGLDYTKANEVLRKAG